MQVAARPHELQEGIADFLWALIPSIPAVLVAAFAEGFGTVAAPSSRPMKSHRPPARRDACASLSNCRPYSIRYRWEIGLAFHMVLDVDHESIDRPLLGRVR